MARDNNTNNNSQTPDGRCVTVKTLKFLPVVATLMSVVHVAFLLMGVNEVYTEIAVVCGGFYVVHRFSHTLHFCVLHKLLTYYSYAMMCCVWWQRHGFGFGEYLEIARGVMFFVGLILLFLLALKRLYELRK
ncbi:MAG: hypothetical protein KBT34_02830 [Prevotella sp.]|nr:hypothetical protein [Candidatus Prevotella equi]